MLNPQMKRDFLILLKRIRLSKPNILSLTKEVVAIFLELSPTDGPIVIVAPVAKVILLLVAVNLPCTFKLPPTYSSFKTVKDGTLYFYINEKIEQYLKKQNDESTKD